MNRRDFLGYAAATAAAAAVPRMARAESVAPRNRRPYSDLDWSTCLEVHTTTHDHSTSQKYLTGYLDRGFELLALSNYYPSAPYVPAAKMTERYYWIHNEDIPVMVNGVRTNGPFDWNAIISQWEGSLSAEQRAQLPLTEGDKLFSDVPEGIMEVPNAEHHRFTDSNMHMCSPGSWFASGTFDAHDRFKTHSHGYNYGTGEPWRTSVSRMIDALAYPDGGGVTINHPEWSKLTDAHICDVLDYDPRVLGIEVYNQSCASKMNWRWGRTYCEGFWDRVLSTGRQCFGFFVPDWAITQGVNVLLVPEKTVHACLQAYRKGNFYGAIKGRGLLRLKSILFDGSHYRATFDRTANIQIVSRQGVVAWGRGTSLDYTVGASERSMHTYLRVRAFTTGGDDETVFSQPTMLIP